MTDRNEHVTIWARPSRPSAPAVAGGLFVYGSLTKRRLLEEVIGHAFRGESLRARLSGYRSVRNAAYPFPFLVARAGASTHGVLLTDLSDDDLRVLDGYEEVSQGVYRRVAVEVEVWGCGAVPSILGAQAYVAGPALLRLAASPASPASRGPEAPMRGR